MHTRTPKKVGKASSQFVWLSRRGSKEILCTILLYSFIHTACVSRQELNFPKHVLHKFLFLSKGNRMRRKFSYFELCIY